jgi:hypothetical protein
MDVKAALKHPGQIIFNAEYDTHYPSLTVAETLKFALKMKTPANRPNGISQKEYEDGQSASGSPQSVSILFVQRADDHVVRLIQNTSPFSSRRSVSSTPPTRSSETSSSEESRDERESESPSPRSS